MAGETRKHRWRFYSAGGFEQAQIETGEDLAALETLDQKLWVALACPVDGLEFDKKTLDHVDLDNDGRIRAPELLGALKWTISVLKDPNHLSDGSPKLPLSRINDSAEGKRLASSARQILKNLGKKGAPEITVDDTTDTAKIFAETKFNGDGIIPVTSADDEDLRKTIEDCIARIGTVKDRSGLDGVNQELVDKLFTEAEAYSAWWKTAETDAANVLPLGEGTAAAAAVFEAVKPKIDDYFTRTRLAVFDARAGAPLNRDPAEYAALAPKLLSERMDEVAGFPIARVEANRPLQLTEGLNPAWTARVKKFRDEVVTPILGDRTEITEAEWESLSAKFAAHEKWLASKAGAVVEPLGLARVRAMLDGDHKGKITALIDKDKALEPEANAIALVDKLVRFHRDLHRLVNNFVTFRDFYGGKKGIFQAGTLYLDGRSCDLCIKVNDAGAHAAVATLSGTYLAYCDVVRKATGEKMTIATAITGGDSNSLMVGRNGLFYDRKGNDWDATIVKIVDHPISVRQAFWLPYRRIMRLIEEQIEKFAASRDKEVHEKAAANVADAGATVEAPKPAPSAFDIAKFAGIFAAIGLAIGAIGGALSAAASGFFNLAWWQMPFVVVGVVLLISGPSMLIAYMKLRRRNIAPLLDASGWAVNARAKLNIRFGASLTQVAELPKGASRSFEDPFVNKWPGRIATIVVLLLLVAIAYLGQTGRLEKWLKDLQTAPPAASASAAAAGTAAPSGAPAASGTAAAK